MARHMSDRAVEATVNQLVAAEEERRAAQAVKLRFEEDYDLPTNQKHSRTLEPSSNTTAG